jgi:glycosyltransferase involved in cell wall biosynthesis
MPSFSFNGRFLHAKPTGVQRVASNIIRTLDTALSAGMHTPLSFDILTPKGPRQPLPLQGIEVRESGNSSGQLWEQVELPLAPTRGRLINLCNAAPLFVPSAATMIHDGQVYITPESYSPGFAAWYRFSQPRICARAQVVLTVSEFSKRILVENHVASEDRIVVIHNGVDHVLDVPSTPDALPELGLVEFEYVVVFANFQKHKNFELILRLWALGDLDRTKLVVIGDVDWDRIKQHYQLDPIRDVLLAGRRPDGAVRALLENAACLVFPSTTEGFGLPPLEAMLLGCPVVAAPMGAVPEVCGAVATYADAGAPEAWRAAILDHIRRGRDPEQQAALRRHASTFTWKRAVDQLISILEQL